MRDKECVTRVLYVRHGQTDFPIDRIYCDGAEDPELNVIGLDQAKQAAAALANYELAAIYASPSARTLRTAQEIASHHRGLDVKEEPVLRERRFGVWDGLFFDQIKERYPDGFDDWKSRQAEYAPEGGESMFDVLARIRPRLESWIEEYRGQTVVVVSHVGPIRAMVCDALGLPLAEYRRLTIDTASVSCIDYGSVQNNLIFMNFPGIGR